MTENPKRTPLYDLHVELGGKIVDFAGWSMPVQYPAGILKEHEQCRTQAALFDVSHMGQVIIEGEGAAEAMEALVPGNITGLKPGQARYTQFTNAEGGILDDLIVSNAGDYLFVVVNAGCRDADIAHMRANLPGHLTLTELTDRGLVALQGPASEAVLASLCPEAASLSFMETIEADVSGIPCRISRLGYTGEDGYEISMPADRAIDLSRILLGHDKVLPAGLGARDSLRLEAGLCLYGHDISTETTPIEAGLQWSIAKRRREEGGFPGADVIQAQLADGPARKLVGIKPDGPAPAREGTEVLNMDGDVIGIITSGGFGPTVGGPVAMGHVEAAYAQPGMDIQLLIRKKARAASVAKLPFVEQNYKR
ncbi:glycine cleavage system aminomethyltransferase GcvT [Coralliovum pocilloporae]|uniref:glycine cleavage system aminomethyltransferase GcvT n=1 Tax=Coralliovum pocilloporae TaxID=3066369 RepID=UPI003307A726